MLTFLRKISVHLGMVLIILSAANIAYAFGADFIGEGVYDVTFGLAIFLQCIIAINLFCLLESDDNTPFALVQDVAALNCVLVLFVSVAMITLSFTKTPYFLVVVLVVLLQASLGFRIYVLHKRAIKKS